MTSDSKYVSLFELSSVTRLSAAWLKREADAHRLPHLRVGRRLMFDIQAVRAALAEMAAKSRATGSGEEASNAS